MGTLANKSVIDVIGKALYQKATLNNKPCEYTLSKVAEIKKQFEEDEQSTREQYKDLFYYYDGLVDCVISQSQHPAGIIASPVTLSDFCGKFIGKDGQEILPLDMDCCHDVGLVKYDILGLKTVGVIDKTCKLLGRSYPKVHEIDFNDQKIYEDMTNDHTAIFQFESEYAGDCLKKMDCHNIFDMSLANACIRPSAESYRENLFAKIPNKNPSEIIDKLLESNYGYLVYQEDTIAFLQQICGFSGSDADNVRRAIGRKKIDELNKALPKILDGYCSKSDKPREVAEKEAMAFLKVIEDSSSYQFGKNHSLGYSIMSYFCGYFRYYYPVEFCTSFLNCAKNDDDIMNGTRLAQSRGISIVNPKFRFSTNEYGCDPKNKVIYKGVASIKNIGKTNGTELYALKDNHYESFIDLLDDIYSTTSVNSKQLAILTKLDFFSEFGNPNYLLYVTDVYNRYKDAKVLTRSKINDYELNVVLKHCGKQTEKQLRDIDNMAIIKELCSVNIETDAIQQIHYDLMLTGHTDKKVECGYFGVMNVDTTNYGTTYATVYYLNNGTIGTYRVNKKWLDEYTLKQGDIIECAFDVKEKRIKTDNGDWVVDTTAEPITYIKMFSIKVTE